MGQTVLGESIISAQARITLRGNIDGHWLGL